MLKHHSIGGYTGKDDILKFSVIKKAQFYFTVINVVEHIADELTPQPPLSATVASLHPETSPAATERSHTPSPAHTNTYTQSLNQTFG